MSNRKHIIIASLALNAILALVLVRLCTPASNDIMAVPTRVQTPSTSVAISGCGSRSMPGMSPMQLSNMRMTQLPRQVSVNAFRNTVPRNVRAAKVTSVIKLALDAGKANPAPPVGPALGAAGVNIMQFCKEYNAATSTKAGQVIPVEITVFADRSFTFILKTPPASKLLLKAAGLEKGSGTPDKETIATITRDQLKEIAEIKLPDLNAKDIEGAMSIIEGTAKNMGIKIEAAAA
ncbi:hypothetical protein AAMO2058_000990700 [Amorphochlora amoebiformis]